MVLRPALDWRLCLIVSFVCWSGPQGWGQPLRVPRLTGPVTGSFSTACTGVVGSPPQVQDGHASPFHVQVQGLPSGGPRQASWSPSLDSQAPLTLKVSSKGWAHSNTGTAAWPDRRGMGFWRRQLYNTEQHYAALNLWLFKSGVGATWLHPQSIYQLIVLLTR